MLDTLRNSANSFLAKLLLGLVALSFIWWGTEGRSGRWGGSALATVDGHQITASEFQRAYENEIARLSQRARRRITSEEARLYGIDRAVLNRLVVAAALDTQVHSLGLALSDQTVADGIRNDEGNKGIDGKFDRAGFELYLRNIGMTERAFIAQKRKEDERNLLTSTLLGSVVTPKPIVDAMYAYNEETRVIEFLTLDPEKSVRVPEPGKDKLAAFYEADKARYKAPEYRKVEVLMMSVDDLKTAVQIADADITASYEQTKEDYATPELRRIQQIAFKDKAAADAAAAAIAGGKNFMTVAQEMGLKDKDIELGLINKKALIDPKIADAAFALERDKVSAVVQGKFATVLLRATEIKAGRQPTLDEVKATVRDKLARAKAKEDIQKLRDNADDLRNAGKTDREIADALKLKVITIESTDATGKTPDGKTALDHPDAKAIIAAAFEGKAGIDRDAIELADGGYAWAATVATTAPRQKPFEEVEAEVITAYFAAERKRLLQELAAKIVDRVNAGESLDKIATEVSGKTDKTPAITRTTAAQGLTEASVNQAFGLYLNKAGSAETFDGKSRLVMKVAEIKAAEAPSKERTERLAREIGQALQMDVFEAYVMALQDSVGANINEAEFRRLAGAGQGQ